MVTKNLKLDLAKIKKAQGKGDAARANTPQDQWSTGTVVEALDNGLVAVELDNADDGWPPVVAPADAGVTAVGAAVRVIRDSTGRVSHVAAPYSLPDGSVPLYVGSTGAFVKEISDAQGELDSAIAGATADAAAAQSAAQSAANDAAAAMVDAGEAITVASTKTSVKASHTSPDSPMTNDLWFPLDDAGNVIGMKQWSGSSWVDYRLMAGSIVVPGSVGNILLEDGSVTAPKITASEELSAKIATFLQVTTEMLLAGDVRVTGTMLANTINLASELIAGDPAGIHTVLDGAGLHVQNGASRLMDLGVTAGPTGVSMRNPKTGSMQSLSGMVFGGEFFTRSDVIEIRSSGTGWTEYAHEYLSPEFVAQSERYAVIYTFQMGNSDVGAQIEAPVDMRWRRGSGGWDAPTDYTRFFVASAYTVPLDNRGDLRMSVVSTVPGRTYRLFNAFRARRNDSSAGLYRIASRSALLLPI